MATVLVVDDDVDVQGVIVMALELAGHEVLLASDGGQALRLCGSDAPDVLITDVLMPKRSGIDLVMALNSLEKRPNVIVISGMVVGAFLDAACEVGVERIFTKPFDVHAIVQAVGELTAGTGPSDR